MNRNGRNYAKYGIPFVMMILLLLTSCVVNWPIVIESRMRDVKEHLSKSRYAAIMLELREEKQHMARETSAYFQLLNEMQAAYPADVLPASLPADLRMDFSQIVFMWNKELPDELRIREIENIAGEVLFASHVIDLETLWNYNKYIEHGAFSYYPDDYELLMDKIQPARDYLRAQPVTYCTWRPDVCEKLINNQEVTNITTSRMDRLFQAVDLDAANLISTLIAQGDTVNSRADIYESVVRIEDKEFTPLHYAAYLGREEVALELIKSGANVQAKTKNGRTPLHMAAVGGRARMARLLVDNGADPRVKDNFYVTPLSLARRYHEDKHATRLIDILSPKPKGE